MKLSPAKYSARRGPCPSAFTLVEMVVSLAIFSFLMLGVVAVQIFALRMYAIGTAKLTTGTGARQTLNAIRDEIRSCKTVYVGNYTNGTGFTPIPSGTLQKGNAVEIASTTITNNFLIYYLDTTRPTNTLFCISNNVAATLTPLAYYITNYYCFLAEDYQGVVQTAYVNNPVIHVLFQFNQYGYPVGSGSDVEFYYLNTRIERRSLN
jgi:prepilin-type N-terminal cleavage/methylation domain-containing protein